MRRYFVICEYMGNDHSTYHFDAPAGALERHLKLMAMGLLYENDYHEVPFVIGYITPDGLTREYLHAYGELRNPIELIPAIWEEHYQEA